ncbi:unnamed protein product [Calypogeia fissa]
MISAVLKRHFSGAVEKGILLWVKFQGSKAVRVDTTGASSVYDVVKLMQRELAPVAKQYGISRLDLVTLDGKKAIFSDSVASICVGVSAETPLTLLPVVKKIFVRKMMKKSDAGEDFEEVITERSKDIRLILEGRGRGLCKLSDPGNVVTKLEQVEDGEKYDVCSWYEQSIVNEVRWQQREDQAMEEEVILAFKNFLQQEVGECIEELPRQLYALDGKILQEWEGIFRVGETLYLCEAKHYMSLDQRYGAGQGQSGGLSRSGPPGDKKAEEKKEKKYEPVAPPFGREAEKA